MSNSLDPYQARHFVSPDLRLDPDQAQHFVGPDLGQNCMGESSSFKNPEFQKFKS